MAHSTFEQFVGDSLPALMRHAYALTGSVHAGEDLVQDTLVRLALESLAAAAGTRPGLGTTTP